LHILNLDAKIVKEREFDIRNSGNKRALLAAKDAFLVDFATTFLLLHPLSFLKYWSILWIFVARRYRQRYRYFSFFITIEQFLLAKIFTLILTKTNIRVPKPMLWGCKRIAFAV